MWTMPRTAAMSEAEAAAARVREMEARLVAMKTIAAGEELAAVEIALRERHPKLSMQLTDYEGRVRAGALAAYMAARGLKDYTEFLTFVDGDARDGGLCHAPSTIPDAGEGLFTTRAFKEGELLCVYRGVKLSLANVNKLSLAAGERDYVMGGFGFLWHINAGPRLDVKARYINDALQKRAHNVRFVKLKQDLCAKVVARRDIAAGDELFAMYGESFWKCRGIAHPYGEGHTAADEDA